MTQEFTNRSVNLLTEAFFRKGSLFLWGTIVKHAVIYCQKSLNMKLKARSPKVIILQPATPLSLRMEGVAKIFLGQSPSYLFSLP